MYNQWQKYQIQQVKCTKFLGIYIDELLNWKEHIDFCRRKVTSGSYAIIMTKRILPERSMYYSLINPYLQYGNLVWGSTFKVHLNKLISAQKWCVRINTNSNYNEHSSPLFKCLGILKFDNIDHIEVAKLM